MRELRLKYIIKDKIDYTNEVISKKPGVGIRKIKFLLNTFEFQQRKISRMSARHSRLLTSARSIKQQQLVSNFFPVLSRLLLPIIQHYKVRPFMPVGNVQQQLLVEKARIATLLEICRTRNLFFKLALVHRALFSLVSLPTLLQYCTAFFGNAAFFPLEL